MPRVHVNDARIYVEDTGAPDGRPDAPVVVFGHGQLMSGRMFATQVVRLRARYRCVSIDWRDQGRCRRRLTATTWTRSPRTPSPSSSTSTSEPCTT